MGEAPIAEEKLILFEEVEPGKKGSAVSSMKESVHSVFVSSSEKSSSGGGPRRHITGRDTGSQAVHATISDLSGTPKQDLEGLERFHIWEEEHKKHKYMLQREIQYLESM